MPKASCKEVRTTLGNSDRLPAKTLRNRNPTSPPDSPYLSTHAPHLLCGLSFVTLLTLDL